MTRNRSTEFGIAAGLLILSIWTAATAAHAPAGDKGAWPHPTFYTVVARPGDTLARVAARYDVSAAALAEMNGLKGRSTLAAGEVLRIPTGSADTRKAVLAEALDRSAANYASPPKTFGAPGHDRTHEAQATQAVAPHVGAAFVDRNIAAAAAGRFVWPVRGPVISSFGTASDGERNDGINIAAMLGAPIHAAASGTVTYAGNELKDYGNLILIAHPGGYLTAYAHAQSIAVARGDRVEKGQVIGTTGETGGVDRPQLHFEIRDGLKPVNPVRLLAALP